MSSKSSSKIKEIPRFAQTRKNNNDSAIYGLAEAGSQISSPKSSDTPSFLACHESLNTKKRNPFQKNSSYRSLLTTLFFLFLLSSIASTPLRKSI
jgi:hypothetical protein